MRKDRNLLHRPWYKLLISLISTLLLLAALPGLAQETPVPKAPAPVQISEAEALNLGVEAYIYGYPLVMTEIIRSVMTNVAAPEGNHAPLGQFAHQRQYPDASFRGAATPNRDLLYSFAWLDLSKEPYVLSLPDEKGRYYLMEMLDAWTNVFAAPGKRTTGTKAQKYVISGPDWQGRLPRGVKQLKSPTNVVWIIGRTYCTGTPADYQAVHVIQDRYTLMPLSSFGQPYTPLPGTVDPRVDMRTSGWEQLSRMAAVTFFKTMAAALRVNPPAPADAPMLAKLAKIGIVPGQDFAMSQPDPTGVKGLEGAAKAAQEKIAAHEKNAGVLVNGWTFTLKTGVYGTDYLQRAYITRVNLGANRPQDEVDLMTQVDDEDKPLAGAHRYVLHFPKGQTPPGNGFWSLTMYNGEYFFVANPLNRYKIGLPAKFKHNRDGSLNLYAQKDSPGRDKESNWLPAPDDKFILMLRLYWPKESVLKGTWKPPVVKRVQ